MFKLLKFFTVLALGTVLGFHLNGLLMQAECNAAVGNWSGTVCMVNEPVQ